MSAHLDLLAVHLALRNRALSLVVATTGATDLSATATGYHRVAGSFVADGLVVGMEITPEGFATNTVAVLSRVTALDLTTPARVAEVAGAARTISVKPPQLRAFENTYAPDGTPFTPVAGRQYITEDFVPATKSLMGSKDGGEVEHTGLYVLIWYGLPGIGVSALRKSVDALAQLFAPGTQLTAGAHYVRIRGDQAPQSGQIIPLTGWSALKLTIPWRARNRNAIAV